MLNNVNIKNIIYFIIIVIIVIFITLIIKNAIIKKTTTLNKNFKEYNINPKEYVKDREYIEKNNILYFGTNIKELNNDFFDIQVICQKDIIKIGFNKIYKEEYSEKLYVDKNYLFEIMSNLKVKYGLNLEDVALQEMVVLISDKYMDYKENKESNISNFGQIGKNLKYSFEFDNDKNLIFFNIIYV